MKLYVIRHASTNFNDGGYINSQYDDGLSENGKKQLVELVKNAKHLKFDKIYCSSLRRAIDTAKPLALDHNLDINVDDRIIEVDFGKLTGKNSEEMITATGKTATDLLNSYVYDFSVFEGESFIQVKNRVKEFINFINQKNEDVAVITHSGVIRCIYFLIKNQKVGSFPNVSIHEFEI